MVIFGICMWIVVGRLFFFTLSEYIFTPDYHQNENEKSCSSVRESCFLEHASLKQHRIQCNRTDKYAECWRNSTWEHSLLNELAFKSLSMVGSGCLRLWLDSSRGMPFKPLLSDRAFLQRKCFTKVPGRKRTPCPLHRIDDSLINILGEMVKPLFQSDHERHTKRAAVRCTGSAAEGV